MRGEPPTVPSLFRESIPVLANSWQLKLRPRFGIISRMKLHIGSIQRRGRLLYLVTKVNGKQKWVSLKTGERETALHRARQLLPPEDGESAWLSHLSRLGAAAELELKRRSARALLTWQNLWAEFMTRAAGSMSLTSETSYERWMRILAETADSLGFSPDDILKKESCAKITARLMGAYISARRMLVFYRRVWRTLGLDCNLWESPAGFAGAPRTTQGREREHFRRLTLDEIRKVRDRLAQIDPELADMVLLGYSTGLRLSDVASLKTGDIDAKGNFLRVVPNKTRNKKPVPLRIPLTDQARALILRHSVPPPDEDGHLFSTRARNRPSRRITAAFRGCGIFARENCRASFHSLRATFISMMDDAGIPPHVTDAITGHSGGGMHSRYTQPSPQAMIDAVARAIPPL